MYVERPQSQSHRFSEVYFHLALFLARGCILRPRRNPIALVRSISTKNRRPHGRRLGGVSQSHRFSEVYFHTIPDIFSKGSWPDCGRNPIALVRSISTVLVDVELISKSSDVAIPSL